jgi:hypothetical protein
MDSVQSPALLQLLGAGGFGFLIGWYVYFINRHRKGDVQMSDLVTLIGVVGGASVTALFPQKSDLFGAYGLGLFAGFFWYFAMLLILVAMSDNFNSDWFLDGRRKDPQPPYSIPEGARPPMDIRLPDA